MKSSLIQPLQGIQQGYAVGYDFCHGLNVTVLVDKIVSASVLIFDISRQFCHKSDVASADTFTQIMAKGHHYEYREVFADC